MIMRSAFWVDHVPHGLLSFGVNLLCHDNVARVLLDDVVDDVLGEGRVGSVTSPLALVHRQKAHVSSLVVRAERGAKVVLAAFRKPRNRGCIARRGHTRREGCAKYSRISASIHLLKA